MATEWIKYALVIAKDKTVANGFASMIDPDSGGHLTFTDNTGLRLIGSQSTTPTAWFAGIPLRQRGYDIIEQFTLGQVHPFLADKGVTQQSVTAAQPAFIIQIGDRAELESAFSAFIQSNGYEVIPS